MSRIRLFIADVDEAHIANVCRAVAACEGIVVAGTAQTGGCALRQVALLQPDVLLTDIQLPELDGISLIRECGRLKSPPACIVCTRFYSPLSMEYAAKNGAVYFYYKPIDYSRLPSVVRECHANRIASRRPQADIHERDEARETTARIAGSLLSRMGIPAQLTGYRCLVECALRLREDRMLAMNLTCGLYMEIARHSNSTIPRVERSLRSAIAVGYERGDMKRYFNYRPTNREFIEFIARQVEEALADPMRAQMPR